MKNNQHHHRWRTSQVKQQRARVLRQDQTTAESALWEALRNRRLNGFKFRRQHPIGSFIVDFCCIECRLIIEIDGLVHQNQSDYDEERTALLQTEGYHVVRYANEQVTEDLVTVLESIRCHLANSK